MDTVPASGLIRQHEECRLHISRTCCFPLGIWAPSQPWPCGWPASDPFGHQAMLAAGVENTGSKLARSGRCPAGAGKGRAVTEGVGAVQWLRQHSCHTLPLEPPLLTLLLPTSSPRASSIAPSLQPGPACWRDQSGHIDWACSEVPFSLCPVSPSGVTSWTPAFRNPSVGVPQRGRAPPIFSAASPYCLPPLGQMLWPGSQAGPRLRSTPRMIWVPTWGGSCQDS